MRSPVGLNNVLEKTNFAMGRVGGSEEKMVRKPVNNIPSTTAFKTTWNCRGVFTSRGRTKRREIPRPYRAIWYMAGKMKLYEIAPRISPKMTHRKKNLDSDKIRLLFVDQSNSCSRRCQTENNNSTKTPSVKYKGIGPILIPAFCKAVRRKTKRPSQNSFSCLLSSLLSFIKLIFDASIEMFSILFLVKHQMHGQLLTGAKFANVIAVANMNRFLWVLEQPPITHINVLFRGPCYQFL